MNSQKLSELPEEQQNYEREHEQDSVEENKLKRGSNTEEIDPQKK